MTREIHISKVKAWKDEKGYGFIHHPTPGGPDLFIHFKGIIGRGRKSLHPGDEVQFNIEKTEKGLSAVNVLTRCPERTA